MYVCTCSARTGISFSGVEQRNKLCSSRPRIGTTTFFCCALPLLRYYVGLSCSLFLVVWTENCISRSPVVVVVIMASIVALCGSTDHVVVVHVGNKRGELVSCEFNTSQHLTKHTDWGLGGDPGVLVLQHSLSLLEQCYMTFLLNNNGMTPFKLKGYIVYTERRHVFPVGWRSSYGVQL